MSTGTVGAIKGGMAFVQAYLDDNPLSQGLAKLQTKLKSWQASLSKLGAGAYGGELPEPFAAIARFAASPAGAFSALLGAAKLTADAREEMLKMSETTGVSVEKLSALSYAARRAGVSTESLAAGLRKMQSKEFSAAFGGGKNGALMAGMGLGGGDAADQFRKVVAQFEKLDQVSRVGLAKKLGLTDLLPLINQGVAGLDAFTQRAKDLGLVMGEEDAKAGKQFTLALGDLHDVLMSSVSAIGGALVPMITGLTNIVVKVAVTVRDWIKTHQALTMAIFLGTGAIVAAGIAVKLLAIGFGLLGAVITVVSGIATLVAHPFLLIGAALAAMAGYIIYISGILGDFGKMFGEMGTDAAGGIGAISKAIAGGDIEKAWKVVTSFMTYEWAKTMQSLGFMWEGFVNEYKRNFPLMTWAMGGEKAKTDLEQAHEEAKTINDRANSLEAMRKEFEAAKAAANAVKTPELAAGPKGPQAFAAGASSEQRGTFSGAAAALLGGGGSVAEKQLKAELDGVALQREHIRLVEQGRRDLKEIRDYLKSWGLVQ